jgi:hypothetical protein
MEIYARQAKEIDLIANATELRMRAERRLGELIDEQRKAGTLARGARGQGRPKKGGFKKNPPNEVSLRKQGIGKSLADRARKAAAMPIRGCWHQGSNTEVEVDTSCMRRSFPGTCDYVSRLPKRLMYKLNVARLPSTA